MSRRRSKKKRTSSTAAGRLQIGRRATTVGDLHALAGMGEDVDIEGLAGAMVEAEALFVGYTKFRKHIREIDAALAQDPDNLPIRRPSSPAERRREWQKQEQAMRDAYRAMASRVPLATTPAERESP